jgi:aldehyde dehydrogenase (NAD+)
MASSITNIPTGSHIAGSWVHPQSTELIRTVNPANPSKIVMEFPAATGDDVETAVSAAAAAFQTWRQVPAPERGRVLWRAADIARRRLEEIATIMSLEEGKILRESRGEVMKGISLLEYYAGEGYRIGGQTLPSELPNVQAFTLKRPLGVVGLITPWNFPWAIPVWKIAPAIVAGNTAVLKPAELTPGTAAIFMDILQEAGLPDGVVNMLMGTGTEVGAAIVNHPQIRAISFTGSNEVGMLINQQAAKRGIPVTCEMGGKNALIVMEDADLETAVSAIVSGAFGATGQRCTATSRVIVTPSVKEELLERIVAKAAKLKIGDGMDESVDIAPAVDKQQYQQDLRYLEIAKSEGATLLCGGSSVDINGGYFVQPTLYTDVQPEMRIFQEEIFGPILSVCEVKDLDEALTVANGVQFGLAASIFTQDIGNIMNFMENIEVGMVHINEPTIGGEAQLPFGGAKSTGIGPREMGQDGLNFFTELKTVFINYSGSGEKATIR